MRQLVLFLGILLALNLSAQHIDERTGISIEFIIEDNDFPENWTRNPINGYGVSLDSSEYSRSLKIIKKALDKYPAHILKTNLEKIFVVKSINFYGVGYGGTASSKNVYVANNGVIMGYTDQYIEKTFHHEFSSILMWNYPSYFNEKEWKKLNKISYGSGGVEALKSDSDSQEIDSVINENGFLFEYAFSSIENDFNSFAENIFSPTPDFWDTVEKFPILKHKLELIIRFYNQLDNKFSLEYFKSFK